MRHFLNLNHGIVIALSFFILGCAAGKVTVSPYIGEWDYTFPTMDGGEMNATMTINESENGFSGFLSSEMGSVDLGNLVIEGGNMTANFDIQGYGISMKGKFEGDTYTGTTIFDGNEFPMNALRKQEIKK